MAKVRKPYNARAVLARSCRAIIKTNHAAIANVQPPDRQIMIDWKHCKQIRSAPVADALCDIAHHWTIYISVFCQKPDGSQYSKSMEFSTDGMHLVANLEQVMMDAHAELVAQSNANHRIGSGWIAIPDKTSLTEEQANRVFSAMGVWNRVDAA